MRVLHILHTSLPHIAGYTIRSNYIIQFQQDSDIEPFVVTSAQDPSDKNEEEIDGITYLRTPNYTKKLVPLAREAELMRALYFNIEKAIKRFDPQIIHAHSPVLVGMPALIAARRHNIPFVYEVRDLWENASVDRGKFKEDGLFYKGARGFESIIYKKANAVVAICEKLRQTLVDRVGRETALHVVGNGVEVNSFIPEQADEAIKEEFGLQNKRCLGYIGTFQPYEGLSTLVSAMPRIAEKIENAHLMITGAGGVEEELRTQVKSMQIDNLITFTGRVAHDRVKDLYRIPELFVYPRILTRTTAITTPLKPLEAMATAKPVLVSDVGAMLELVQPDKTGMIFEANNANDLADKAIYILEDSARQKSMGQAARQWVVEKRQWPYLVANYKRIYENLLNN